MANYVVYSNAIIYSAIFYGINHILGHTRLTSTYYVTKSWNLSWTQFVVFV